MKLYTSLLIIAIIAGTYAITDEQRERRKKISDECITETGATQEDVDKFLKGEDSGEEKVKKHCLCFGKKAGLINDDGEIQVDTIKTRLISNIDRVLEDCSKKRATPEDTIYETVKCIRAARRSDFSIA